MAKGFGRKEPQAVTKRQKAYMKLIGDLLTCRITRFSSSLTRIQRAKQWT